MKKAIPAAMLVFAALSTTALASQALAPQDQYTVIINNTCHREVRVAIHYQHPERGWITEGWWEVDGNSELPTGIMSIHNQFYMFGDTEGDLQWPPERSRKQYNRYGVLEGDFVLEDGATVEGIQEMPFSLKEISPASAGLKARFDC